MAIPVGIHAKIGRVCTQFASMTGYYYGVSIYPDLEVRLHFYDAARNHIQCDVALVDLDMLSDKDFLDALLKITKGNYDALLASRRHIQKTNNGRLALERCLRG